jgi:hypothetical protein
LKRKHNFFEFKTFFEKVAWAYVEEDLLALVYFPVTVPLSHTCSPEKKEIELQK